MQPEVVPQYGLEKLLLFGGTSDDVLVELDFWKLPMETEGTELLCNWAISRGDGVHLDALLLFLLART